VRVTAGVPETFPDLIRQQIRWRKSFIRSLTATGGVYWRRPFYAALIYYLTLALRLTRPFVALKVLILLPFIYHDLVTTTLYLVSLFYTGMLYGIDVRLRNPGYPYWLYRPIMTFLSTFVLSWLIFYAAVTIKKESWR
jgi:hyaluronan synthase